MHMGESFCCIFTVQNSSVTRKVDEKQPQKKSDEEIEVLQCRVKAFEDEIQKLQKKCEELEESKKKVFISHQPNGVDINRHYN